MLRNGQRHATQYFLSQMYYFVWVSLDERTASKSGNNMLLKKRCLNNGRTTAWCVLFKQTSDSFKIIPRPSAAAVAKLDSSPSCHIPSCAWVNVWHKQRLDPYMDSIRWLYNPYITLKNLMTKFCYWFWWYDGIKFVRNCAAVTNLGGSWQQ